MNEKIITYYLPQYHSFPENDNFWGKGFTEWNNVKKAKPLFQGHDQPRIPINHEYYDLSDVSVMRRQADLAKKYGVYGWCFYHYWFYEKPVMDKPLHNYLNSDIDLPFCFCWANESWTNLWAGTNLKTILEQKYGDKSEWKRHFEFLLPFIKDKRYIKVNGKPLIVIYRPFLYDKIIDMLEYWKQLARDEGLEGLTFASQQYVDNNKYPELYAYLDLLIEYQPDFARARRNKKEKNYLKDFESVVYNFLHEKLNLDFHVHHHKMPKLIDYDTEWKEILDTHPRNEKSVAGAFIDWDNTPRYGVRGIVYTGVTPEKFCHYLSQQIEHVRKEYKQPYIFLFAWNEWGEGAYLDPDESHKYGYLEAIKEATASMKEESMV